MAEGGHSAICQSTREVDMDVENDVGALYEDNVNHVVVPYEPRYANITFCDATTTSRMGYYQYMRKVVDNLKVTRWPTHEVVKSIVDVNLVKLNDIPKGFNPVRALILASDFDQYPLFRLATNCIYIVVPTRGNVQLFTHEEYPDEEAYCKGAGRMYLKNRKRIWKDRVYIEFAFLNLVSDNFNAKYECYIFPPTKFNSKNREMRVVEKMTMLSYPRDKPKDEKQATTSTEKKKKIDEAAKQLTDEASDRAVVKKLPSDNKSYRFCTSGTVRTLTFRVAREDGNFDPEEERNIDGLYNSMKVRGVNDEFGSSDHFDTKKWSLLQLQQLLENAGVCEEKHLSPEQWSHALRCFRYALSFVQGPPGTGKTKLLVTVAVALAVRMRQQDEIRGMPKTIGKQAPDNLDLEKPQTQSTVKNHVIAIVAKTNKACRVIVEYLRDMWPNFTWVTSKLRERSIDDPAALHVMAAHRMKKDIHFTSWFSHFQGGTDLFDSSEHKRCVVLLDREQYNVLSSVDIIVGTIARIESLNSKHFNLHIKATIVDESSQLTEMEALAALTLYSQRVSFFGDTEQLGPLWVRNEAKYAELSEKEKDQLTFNYTGWFNRMVNRTHYAFCLQNCFGTLRTIYRMPWLQTEFLLLNVYEPWTTGFSYKFDCRSVDDLVSTDVGFQYNESFGTNQAFFGEFRVAFIDTDRFPDSLESTGREGVSLKNVKEANVAAEVSTYAARLFGPKSVVVICMYAEQMYCIEKIITDQKLPAVTVSTVDSFQGDQAEVVIVSTVRKNKERSIGFLAQEQRANVALSRSRRILIVLGSRSTLIGHPLWGPFVKYALNEDDDAIKILESAEDRYEYSKNTV